MTLIASDFEGKWLWMIITLSGNDFKWESLNGNDSEWKWLWMIMTEWKWLIGNDSDWN